MPRDTRAGASMGSRTAARRRPDWVRDGRRARVAPPAGRPPMTGTPPPPPPVVPVPDVDAARASAAAARSLLEATIARASALSEDQRQQRVDGEWSTVESLRHVVLL